MKESQKWFKIKDIERITGISRRTVHFYLTEGLLHPPRKTGKTMSYYDEEHIRKLSQIGRLKEQGLPLLDIRERISGPGKTKYVEAQRRGDFRLKGSAYKDQRLPQRIQGKKTMENIVESASQVFMEKGYKETKISHITKELNIGKGSFYSFFRNKKELFLVCVPRIFQSLFREGWEKIQEEDNPLKRLQLRTQAVVAVRRQFSSILRLSKEVLEDDDPNLRELGNQIVGSIRKPIESDLEKCIEQGLIPSVDPKAVTIITLVLFESIDFIRSVDKDLSESTIIRQFLNAETRGLYEMMVMNRHPPKRTQ